MAFRFGEAITDLLPDPGKEFNPNSILMIVATDAPLLDYQLNRLARRAGHGLAEDRKYFRRFSNDLHLAFSTANSIPRKNSGSVTWSCSSESIDETEIYPLLEAASEATEEAIVNALFMATDMVGRDGSEVHALPLSRTLEVLKRHHRLFPARRPGQP